MPRLSLVGAAANFSFKGLGEKLPILVDYLIVGGGGHHNGGRGGSAGGTVKFASGEISRKFASLVIVGGYGGTSSFNGLNATGGEHEHGDNGGNNASFGGGGNSTWGWDESTWTRAAGGGAGAAGPGHSGYIRDVVGQQQPTGGAGGNGLHWPVNGRYYGAGRGGGTWAPRGWTQTGGPNGHGFGNYGSTGISGVVIISYRSPVAVFSGGSITKSGDRVFHEFTGTAYLIPL